MTPKERYIAALAKLKAELEVIDKDTPWRETEPEWWLMLAEMHQLAINQHQKLSKETQP